MQETTEKVTVRLSELMGKHKIRSIHQLSKETQIRHEVLTKLYNEDQTYSPRYETMIKLCKFFNVSLGELMNFDPNDKGQAS